MKTTFEQEIGRALQEVRLEKNEQRQMRQAIIRHMRLSAPPYTQTYTKRTPSPLSFGVFTMRVMTMAVICLVVVGGGGVSYVAAGALPGDMLYPVKIKINEPVALALTTSPAEKATLAVLFTNRRLEEAGALAAEGKLSSELQKTVTAQLETQVTAVNTHLALLSTSEDREVSEEISDEFEAVLSAHEVVLARIAGTVPEREVDVAQVVETVRGQATKFAEHRIAYAPSASVSGTSATQIMKVASKEAPEVTTMSLMMASEPAPVADTVAEPSLPSTTPAPTTTVISGVMLNPHFLDKALATLKTAKNSFENADLSEDAKSNAEIELLAIEQLIAQAKIANESRDPDTARRLAREAVTRATKFSIFLKAERYWKDSSRAVGKGKGSSEDDR